MRHPAPLLQTCVWLWAAVANLQHSASGVRQQLFDVTGKPVQVPLFPSGDASVVENEEELARIGQAKMLESGDDSSGTDSVDSLSNPWSASRQRRFAGKWNNVRRVTTSVNAFPEGEYQKRQRTKRDKYSKPTTKTPEYMNSSGGLREIASAVEMTGTDLVAEETRYGAYGDYGHRGNHYGGGEHGGYRGHGNGGTRHYQDRYGNHHRRSSSQNSYGSHGGYKGHFDRGRRYWRDQGHGLEARYGRRKWGGHHYNRGQRGSRYNQQRRYSDGDRYGGRYGNGYGGQGGGGRGHHRRYGDSHYGDYGRGGSHRGGRQGNHQYGEHQGTYRNGGSRY